jgi:hypothetical protein
MSATAPARILLPRSDLGNDRSYPIIRSVFALDRSLRTA